MSSRMNFDGNSFLKDKNSFKTQNESSIISREFIDYRLKKDVVAQKKTPETRTDQLCSIIDRDLKNKSLKTALGSAFDDYRSNPDRADDCALPRPSDYRQNQSNYRINLLKMDNSSIYPRTFNNRSDLDRSARSESVSSRSNILKKSKDNNCVNKNNFNNRNSETVSTFPRFGEEIEKSVSPTSRQSNVSKSSSKGNRNNTHQKIHSDTVSKRFYDNSYQSEDDEDCVIISEENIKKKLENNIISSNNELGKYKSNHSNTSSRKLYEKSYAEFSPDQSDIKRSKIEVNEYNNESKGFRSNYSKGYSKQFHNESFPPKVDQNCIITSNASYSPHRSANYINKYPEVNSYGFSRKSYYPEINRNCNEEKYSKTLTSQFCDMSYLPELDQDYIMSPNTLKINSYNDVNKFKNEGDIYQSNYSKQSQISHSDREFVRTLNKNVHSPDIENRSKYTFNISQNKDNQLLSKHSDTFFGNVNVENIVGEIASYEDIPYQRLNQSIYSEDRFKRNDYRTNPYSSFKESRGESVNTFDYNHIDTFKDYNNEGPHDGRLKSKEIYSNIDPLCNKDSWPIISTFPESDSRSEHTKFLLNHNKAMDNFIVKPQFIKGMESSDIYEASPIKSTKSLPSWIIDDMKKLKEKQSNGSNYSMDLDKDSICENKELNAAYLKETNDVRITEPSVSKQLTDRTMKRSDYFIPKDLSSKSLSELMTSFSEDELRALKVAIIRDSLTDVMKEITDDMISTEVKDAFRRILCKGTRKRKDKVDKVSTKSKKSLGDVSKLLGLDVYESDDEQFQHQTNQHKHQEKQQQHQFIEQQHQNEHQQKEHQCQQKVKQSSKEVSHQVADVSTMDSIRAKWSSHKKQQVFNIEKDNSSAKCRTEKETMKNETFQKK